ncbi:MAG: FAD-dependent monooxygenase [Chloroflexota bacterium]
MYRLRACGGDRWRRPDRADVGGRVGASGDWCRQPRSDARARSSYGSRSGGLHSRTIEVLDQRGIVDRFLAEAERAVDANGSTIAPLVFLRSRVSPGSRWISATSPPAT